MKKLLLMAGGTATAWHIANIIKKNFATNFYLIICDTNDPYLVHTSTLADEYIKVPPIASKNYYEKMLSIFKEKKIDIIVPLIDYDIMLFYQDNIDLSKIGVKSTAPLRETSEILSNKENMYYFLTEHLITTPKIFLQNELDDSEIYFVKDIVGFGSRGARKCDGKGLKNITNNQIVQEICQQPEVTVDVVLSNEKIYTACRERMETKSGVCTKAKVYFNQEIHNIIDKISQIVKLPTISCVQFMRNSMGEWSLTDFNMRSGGGTALSEAAGFRAVEAAVNIWNGNNNVSNCLPIIQKERYVVRAYKEILTK